MRVQRIVALEAVCLVDALIGPVVGRIPCALGGLAVDRIRDGYTELHLIAVLALTGRLDGSAVSKLDLGIVGVAGRIAVILERTLNRCEALLAFLVLLGLCLDLDIIHGKTCLGQFLDVEVVAVGNILGNSCRPCGVVHCPCLDLGVAVAGAVEDGSDLPLSPLGLLLGREILQDLAARIICDHCAEGCGVACVVVNRNLGVLVIGNGDLRVIVVAGAVRTADQCAVEGMCILGLPVLTGAGSGCCLGLAELVPVIVMDTGSGSVVDCRRVLVAHAEHIAHLHGVVAKAVVHLGFCPCSELFSLCGICLEHIVRSEECEPCGGGCMTQAAPLEQPCQTVAGVLDVAAALDPVIDVLGNMCLPLVVAGDIGIEVNCRLAGIIPAETPCELGIGGLVLGREIREVVLLDLVDVGLVAGCLIQPACCEHAVVEPGGGIVHTAHAADILGIAPLVRILKELLGVLEVGRSLVGLLVLEYQIALGKCSGTECSGRGILDGVIRTIPVAAVEVMLAEVDLGGAPDVVVSRAALEVTDGADKLAVTKVAAVDEVKTPLEIVAVGLTETGLVHGILVLEIAPCHHGCGVSVGVCELEVVAGIEPAARYDIGLLAVLVHHGISTPRHTVPLRELTGLLHLVEEHRLLECLGIVVVAGSLDLDLLCGFHRCGQRRRTHDESGDECDRFFHRSFPSQN